MRLVGVQIGGYKRFAESATLYVNGPVVSIIGPNEAGKTSVLEALEHLSHENEFARRELTDRQPRDADDVVVRATFVLEASDRNALDGELPADERIEFIVDKRTSGNLVPALGYEFHRDLSVRTDAQARLKSALDRNRLTRINEPVPEGEEPPEEPDSVEARAGRLVEGLESTEDELPNHVIVDLTVLDDALREQVDEEANRELQNVRDVVSSLRSVQDAVHPQDVAEQVLLNLRPQFLRFTNDDQALTFNYRWDEHPEQAPRALANLLAMAEATYPNLMALGRDAERKDELATEENRANRVLKVKMETWGQEELAVAIRVDPEGIEIHVEDLQTSKLTRLSERSDGLKRFVALIAFVYRFADPARANPVLLIDEAETHLHYEAQADLVKVLERQAAAQTVIYTTHSIGCLPEDLGSAIRVVETTGRERSRILVSAWTGTIGLTPMVLAMGADALAFTPARFAVIGEGASDAILLPTLLRQARPLAEQLQPIGFQVAPGVSEVEESAANDLEIEAGNVVYLVDDDEGGRQHAERLPERARNEGRVISLAHVEGDARCTEDFIASEILVNAFNQVVDQTRETTDRISEDDLPGEERGSWLDQWCRDRDEEPTSKPHLAEAILENGRDAGSPIVDESRTAELRALRDLLVEKLEPER